MLNLEIISPVGTIFAGQCLMAVVPVAGGELGVMQDHEAFIGVLQEGKVVVFNEKQEVIKEVLVANGGFAEIHDGQKLVVLVD